MIYSGIEVGMFFEQNIGEGSDCNNLFSVLRPVLQGLIQPFGLSQLTPSRDCLCVNLALQGPKKG